MADIEQYLNKIICGDAIEVMAEMPDASVDLVFADPPYGMGLTDWDKKQDVALFTREAKRILSPNGFYAFYGQMPYILDWCNEAEKSFKYREHISWIKRIVTPSGRLQKGHEEIMIYSLDNARFYKTKGIYEDVKVPGIMFDTVSLEGIKRHISSLRQRLKGSKEEMLSHKANDCYARFDFPGNRSPRECNYTNVWSFLPEAHKTRIGNISPLHPTIKPLLLEERMIEMLTASNMLVLSPFLGSGTTAVTCIKTGRKYIGIELSEEYCEIAEKRIADALAQPELAIAT